MKHSRKEAHAKIDAERDAANASWQKLAGRLAVEKMTSKKVLHVETEKSKLPVTETEQQAGFKVTDRRRNTPQSVEAVFQAEQELLRAPLNPAEQKEAVSRITAAHRVRFEKAKQEYDADPTRHDRRFDGKTTPAQEEKRTRMQDLDGDSRALGRLKQLTGGETISRGDDSHNKHLGMTITERLDDLVKNYAALVPENFEGEEKAGDRRYIASNGGAVAVPENGQIHSGGYNGTLLYEFARARQIWGELEADPYMVRSDILGASGEQGLDISPIMEQPVIVTAADTAQRERIML